MIVTGAATVSTVGRDLHGISILQAAWTDNQLSDASHGSVFCSSLKVQAGAN